MTDGVELREVTAGDLPELYEHQHDAEANRIAAFPARERDAFMEHWAKILADDAVIKRTVLYRDRVAGYVVCYEQEGRWLVGYWIDRRLWGHGIATRALSGFLSHVDVRPLHAHVARYNVGSIRVLEKCGFEVSDEDVEELIFTLASAGG